MKNTIFFYLLILAFATSSCTVFSVHPIYDADNQPGDKRLTGLWIDTDDSASFVEIRGDKNFYTLTRWLDKDTIWYEAHYAKVGDYYYLDLYPLDGKPYKIDDQAIRNFLPFHTFVKLELGDRNAVVSMFDEDKLMTLFRQNRIRLRHELMDDYVLITANTGDLQKFIMKYSASKDVFEAPSTFIKIGP
jgi:hypothetical protein